MVRAGFIDAPLIGPAKKPAAATVSPTASAACRPITGSSRAHARITIISKNVSTTSATNASNCVYFGPGRLAPNRRSDFQSAAATAAATNPPANCEIQ